MPLRIAILASGSGSNAQAIFDKIAAGVLDVEVCIVISNRPEAGVLKRAKAAGVPSLGLDHKAYRSRESFDLAMVEAVKNHNIDLVVLAGYMRILTPIFLDAFANKVINVHPAILPSFPGAHGAQDACAWGVKVSGCTVHFVDEKIDHGPIIAQAVVPVLANDDANTLQQRIQSMEHRIYPQVLQWFADKRVVVKQRIVELLPLNNMQETLNAPKQSFSWPPLENDF